MKKPLTRVLTTLLKWAAVTAIALLMPRSTQRASKISNVASEPTGRTPTSGAQPLTEQASNKQALNQQRHPESPDADLSDRD